MSFPKYEAYKDSGVEWLGDIPAPWAVTPLKHVAILNPNKSDYQGDQNQPCSFLPMEKLKRGTLVLDEKRTVSDVYAGYTYFENGDVLQAKVTPCFENQNVAIAKDLLNGVGFGSSEINVLRTLNPTSTRFLYYRLQENNFMDFCISSMTGVAGLQRIPSDTINNFSIALPKEKEQTQIADFLDHETAGIDALIAEQERLIALLKEKRQAVISHAVTKGCDRAVPMKDSGVEWIGKVPEHWTTGRVKDLVHFVVDGPHFSPSYMDEGVLFISARNVRIDGWSFSDAKFISQSDYKDFSKRVKPERGDVLLTKGGTTGVARAVDFDTPFQVWVHIAVLRPKRRVVVSEYLAYSLNSTGCYAQSQLYTRGATNNDLGLTRIVNIQLTWPSITEQKEIVVWLDRKVNLFDASIVEANQTIELLRERRSALISAAVTGKIDVRNWQPPTSTASTPP